MTGRCTERHRPLRCCLGAASALHPGDFQRQRVWQLSWQRAVFTIAAMNSQNPFRLLDSEWEHLGRSGRARTRLRRWSVVEPALAEFESPADVVAGCQRRGDPAAANGLLGCLLRLADDDLAARSVLQAVAPSLAARAWRRRPDADFAETGLWEDIDDLNGEVIALALDRIRELAGSSPQWPAQAIIDVVWGRLRWSAFKARRRQLPTVALDPDADWPSNSGAELGTGELADLILEAVKAGQLRRKDAAVIYATRILGQSPAELAAEQCRDVRAVRCQRARAERTLMAIAG